ncbi:putative oxidoreductase [Nocardioides marinisabuli]|uniref:Putative oxidoreductase n=1 Tax=Nocardioides marinisabuli TaxID=419476 RepID=A0A7Y9JPR5_9ACTN|nr:DoxX family protein [Nocardioides marinisabuli]NYD55868.1 putative oxidoreductase [Nocardioides marinisabuli]
MKALGTSFLGRGSDLGPLLLRLGVGFVFAVHGWRKIDGGVSNFAPVLEAQSVPAPEVVAWLMTIAEGLGGLALIVGVFTRLVTLPLIAIMVGALVLVKSEIGFIVADAPGGELDTALLAGLLCLLFIGPGRLSVDGLLGMETATAPVSGRARATSEAA